MAATFRDGHRGSASTSYSSDTAETFLSRGRSVAPSSHPWPPHLSPTQPQGSSPSPRPAGQLALRPLREQLPDGVQRPRHQLHPQADLWVVPAGAWGDGRTGAEDVGQGVAAAAVQRPARSARDCHRAGAKHSAAQNGSREDPEQGSQVLGPAGDLRGLRRGPRDIVSSRDPMSWILHGDLWLLMVGLRKKPQCLLNVLQRQEKTVTIFISSVCHKLLPFKTICHNSPKVVVTKSIVFCYYGKMLQLRKYTLMI